jgi:hypothetical protein
LVRFVYLLKFEGVEVPWTLSFRTTKDSWKLVNFSYGRDASEDANAFAVTVPAGAQ